MEVVPLPDVENPGTMYVDSENMYIGEKTSIYIYSLSNFKLLKKFGKKGEGPGEFLPPFGEEVHIHIQPDELMVISSYRLSFFTKSGDFKREMKCPPLILYNRYIRPLEKGFVASSLARGTAKEKNLIMISYNIYDSNFKAAKEIYRIRQGYQGPASKIKFNPITWTIIGPAVYSYDNKIFLGHYNNDGSGTMYVFDSNGKKLYEIHPEYEKVKFTEDDKKAFKKDSILQDGREFYENNKHLFDYPQYFPARQWFEVVDNKIYIQTYKKDKTLGKNEFFILDLKGKLLKRVMLPLDHESYFTPYVYTVKNDKLYQVFEDDDEQWAVRITKIE
jgi:hypothetical protein